MNFKMLPKSCVTCDTYAGFAYGDTTISGTRNPYSYEFVILGATWSYHPPQSSHVMIIAVFDQYGLAPMAFTIDATHDGPEPSFDDAWSDAAAVGITQLTCGNFPAEMSVRTCVEGVITLFVQSGPLRKCWMAFGPVQIEPGVGV